MLPRLIILTPSLNQLGYLRRCVASVRDQVVSGVEVRHWVVDGDSADGTQEWLAAEEVAHVSAPDGGMYEALNRGLERVVAESAAGRDTVFAWLNADEQYLPGTLQRVAESFAARPEVDILCGGALVVDPDGRLLTYWKSLPLRRCYLRTGHLYNLSCGLFFRARVLASGIRFDTGWKAVADWYFVSGLVEQGAVSAVMPEYLAAYTFSAANLSHDPGARAEHRSIQGGASRLHRAGIFGRRLVREAERWWRGTRRERFPLVYELYTDDLERRTELRSDRVPARWPGGGGKEI